MPRRDAKHSNAYSRNSPTLHKPLPPAGGFNYSTCKPGDEAAKEGEQSIARRVRWIQDSGGFDKKPLSRAGLLRYLCGNVSPVVSAVVGLHSASPDWTSSTEQSESDPHQSRSANSGDCKHLRHFSPQHLF